MQPPQNHLTTQLGTVAIFCKAAELGGFTAAAKSLGLTPAAVSRSVGRLEQRLGLQLFRRTTRRVQLTDDGGLYFDQCRAALAQIEDVERSITGRHGNPMGLLRISVPSTYAHYRLLPHLQNFRLQHPNIELEINISHRNVDFVQEGYDLAIRLGEPAPSRLVARKLEDAPVGVYASKAYLARRGQPFSLEELRQPRHTLVPFVLYSTGKVMPWIFLDQGKPIEWACNSDVRVSGEPIGAVILALSGMGLVQTFRWIAEAYQGELVEVLSQYAGRTRPMYVTYPRNRHLSSRVRAFVDFVMSIPQTAT